MSFYKGDELSKTNKHLKLKTIDLSDPRHLDTLQRLDDKTWDLIAEKMGIHSVKLLNALNTVDAMSRALKNIRRQDRENKR